MKMYIYIAGPMTNIPYFNFPLFDEVAEKLRAQGHGVFNPAEADRKRHGMDISLDNPTGDPKLAAEKYGFSLREALAEDLDYICLEATAICMLPGWETSSGAFAEWATARALKHTVMYWS